MPAIRPSSDLRNRYNEISDYCHQHNEPVFITKNGAGDLVVLSTAAYDYLCGKQELHRILDEGLSASKAGNRRPADDVLRDLGKRLGLDNV